MTRNFFTRIRNTEGLTALLLAGSLWLLNHRYGGIWHDARIYTLLAVHQLSPQQFVGDPWFVPKAADGLSVFPYIYGGLIRVLGIDLAAKALVALGALAWLGVGYRLCQHWFEPRLAALLLLVLASVPLSMSPDSAIIVLSETFTTPRLFAMPFTLAAIAAAAERHSQAAAGLGLLALLLHPLLAVWGLAIAAGLYLRDRQIALLTALAATAAAALMLNPMDLPAFRPMDPDWRNVLQATAVIVFHKVWPEIAVNDPLWWFAALLLGSRLGNPKLHRLYALTLLVAAYALLASLLVSYFSQNVFLVQVQLWRALWLAAWFGCIAALDLAWAGPRLLGQRWVWPCFLLTSFLIRDYGGGLLLLALALALAARPESMQRWLQSHRPQAAKALWTTQGLILLLFLPGALVDAHIFLSMDTAPRASIGKDYLLQALTVSQLFILPLLLWCGLDIARRRGRHGASLTAAILLVALCGLFWDARNDRARYEESRYRIGGNRDLFGGAIDPGQTVFWPNGVLRVWFDLGAPSYVSSVQAIGIVFSRERMEEVRHRLLHIRTRDGSPPQTLLPPQAAGLDLHRLEAYAGTTPEGLYRLCSDSALGYFVDETPVAGIAPVASQTETVAGKRRTYYLYDCRRLRHDTAHPA